MAKVPAEKVVGPAGEVQYRFQCTSEKREHYLKFRRKTKAERKAAHQPARGHEHFFVKFMLCNKLTKKVEDTIFSNHSDVSATGRKKKKITQQKAEEQAEVVKLADELLYGLEDATSCTNAFSKNLSGAFSAEEEDLMLTKEDALNLHALPQVEPGEVQAVLEAAAESHTWTLDEATSVSASAFLAVPGGSAQEFIRRLLPLLGQGNKISEELHLKTEEETPHGKRAGEHTWCGLTQPLQPNCTPARGQIAHQHNKKFKNEQPV